MKRPRAKALTSSLPRLFWRYGRARTGYEYHHYPSDRARRLFYHLRAIGEGWPRAGFCHSHRDEKGFLIHFVLNGEFWHRVKGATHVVRANECALLDLTEPVEYGHNGPKPLRVLWVHVDGALLPHVFRELGADFDPVFRNLNRQEMERLIREMMRLTARQPPDYEPRISTLMSALIAELFASRVEALPLPDPGIDPTRLSEPTRKALAMIARYYMQPKTVKGLAAEIGLSRYHFARLFHRETGFTPSDYLNAYRLEAARNFLSTTDKPIRQIARSVGIANVENFSKMFRQRHGLSPRAYRTKAQRHARRTAVAPSSLRDGKRRSS
jgi:AraC-like DNA-binding protein